MRKNKTAIQLWIVPMAVLLFAGWFGSLIAQEEASAKSDELPEFNRAVLALIEEYPTDGTHGYWWPRAGESNYDGGTTDLFLDGKKVMSGEEQGRTFCCGLTLEVFLRAYKEWLDKNPKLETAPLTSENWNQFQRLWYVLEMNGPGPSAALAEYGMGREIDAAEVLPGDFVQIWRTKNENGKMTGHSVVFLNWIRNDGGHIVGFRYWSTQPGTDGIHDRIEYYGPLGGMSTQYTTFGRVELPASRMAEKK